MNKYIILALLPIILQGTLFCSDIDRMIQPQLINAQRVMRG